MCFKVCMIVYRRQTLIYNILLLNSKICWLYDSLHAGCSDKEDKALLVSLFEFKHELQHKSTRKYLSVINILKGRLSSWPW